MVLFDQLRISDNGKEMYINMHVNEAAWFADVYLDKLTIMTSDKVSETNPYSPTSDYIYTCTFEGNQKTANLVLTVNDFIRTWETDPKAMQFTQADMTKTLFFVYVECKGTPDPCTPCGMDDKMTVGVTFYEKRLYNLMMQYTRELTQDCQIPKKFIDLILLWNAFNTAVETGHYLPAIDYFEKMFSGGGNANYAGRRCGCHG